MHQFDVQKTEQLKKLEWAIHEVVVDTIVDLDRCLKLPVQTVVERTLFHFNQKEIDQFYVETVSDKNGKVVKHNKGSIL